MLVNINKLNYKVNSNEYTRMNHLTYENLRIYNELDTHEILIAFIKKINKQIDTNFNNIFIHNNPSHGGFIGLNIHNLFNNLYFTNINTKIHLLNIKNNVFNVGISNIKYINSLDNMFDKIVQDDFIVILNDDTTNTNFNIDIHTKKYIIISKVQLETEFKYYYYKYIDYYVYVSDFFEEQFNHIFNYYLSKIENGKYIIEYDNLLHLCIMVKNAGPQFRDMLQHNLQFIDKWTILDTGSTDETIQIINDVLVGKKEGTLYKEPFINFRDSRNRLLDLAGNECKFIVMLDDTYILNGDINSFLKEVRSDQYADSYTLFIQSDDTKYGSNRIIKSVSGLRYKYKIHEVINDINNINVIVPEDRAYILDKRFDYMETRTMERKQLDLQLLYEELQDDPNNPRTYYYLAQTYNLLGNYEKSFHYFMKRCEFKNSGFLQERVDAAFEAARTANFKLNYSWEVCEKLYLDAFKIDESRPESLYFIGIHYYLENNYKKAYEFFKQGFEIGFPNHCQYSLKPTLSFHFLPKFLTRVCYETQDYLLGEIASHFFILNNNNNADNYEEIISWYKIYQKLNIYNGPKNPVTSENEIFCFVADGGFNPWTGSNILTTGVGGSETYIIEIARYIKKNSHFDVYVFCNTPEEKDEIFEGVFYKHLNSYYKFINTHYIKHCIISRYSEYLPVTFKGFTENVYFVVHDLTASGNVIPMDLKLKNIFCLTEWHAEYFTSCFSILKNRIVPFYYGIDNIFKNENQISKHKHKHKFIYSSFPNRGLLQLLQMWPKIYDKYNTATLHIYSNIDHKWSNDVEPEKMLSIKHLLNEYNYKENGLGIHYYGWVDKKELANAWTTADIWFYPCTFMETFCLTALEAASSKTLCVTNDLAALQNTVGNRGVIIRGDPTTEEWKQQALQQLFYIMDDTNYADKNKLIHDNYNWSQTLSWESQAIKLLENYIYPNNIIEYKGMYNWTHDLPPGSKDIFLKVISYFNNNYHKIKFGQKVSILEIGTYTGTSLIELIKLIPNSTGIAIDMWTNYNESNLLNVIDNHNVKQSFYKNIKNTGLQDKIQAIQIDSTTALINFIKDNKKTDFIYIDGSHLLLDCYIDLALSWQILEKGGILAIDDYLYDDTNILNSPYEAINHFFKIFNGKYKILDIGYRVFLEKI